MSDKISPPSKPVSGAKSGINMPSGHSTITTPNPTMGDHYGSGKPASQTSNKETLFGKK